MASRPASCAVASTLDAPSTTLTTNTPYRTIVLNFIECFALGVRTDLIQQLPPFRRSTSFPGKSVPYLGVMRLIISRFLIDVIIDRHAAIEDLCGALAARV